MQRRLLKIFHQYEFGITELVLKAIFLEEADHRRNARLFKVGGVDDKNLFSLDC